MESSLRRSSSKSMLSWQRSSQGNISHVNIWGSSMLWNRVFMVLVLRGKGRDSFTKNLFTTFDTDNSGTIDFRWNQWKFGWSGLCYENYNPHLSWFLLLHNFLGNSCWHWQSSQEGHQRTNWWYSFENNLWRICTLSCITLILTFSRPQFISIQNVLCHI